MHKRVDTNSPESCRRGRQQQLWCSWWRPRRQASGTFSTQNLGIKSNVEGFSLDRNRDALLHSIPNRPFQQAVGEDANSNRGVLGGVPAAKPFLRLLTDAAKCVKAPRFHHKLSLSKPMCLKQRNERQREK